jgi:3',5'-cyclic AMP phosphodiesterase CpdA
MRVLHFSDVHLDLDFSAIPPMQWLGKRIIGGLNLYFFRRHAFAGVAGKIDQLCAFRREQGIDLVISTGDFTLLGTEPEYIAVRRAVAPMYDAPRGFIAVPGNHDQYVHDTLSGRRFERHFGDAATTDRADLLVDGLWPAVRLIGADIAVISVNSARPNPLPWKSSGRIPQGQLDGLRRALRDSSVASRFVFIITHYTPKLANGEDDRWNHGLVNASEFLEICAPVERGAILCGHVHHCFRVKVPGVGPEIFCAGSATINERAGFWVFDVDGERFTARRGERVSGRYRLPCD